MIEMYQLFTPLCTSAEPNFVCRIIASDLGSASSGPLKSLARQKMLVGPLVLNPTLFVG